jgi:hypothetical protein
MEYSKDKGDGLVVRSSYDRGRFIVESQHIGTTVTRGFRLIGVDKRDEPVMSTSTVVDPTLQAETAGKYVHVDNETGAFTTLAPAEVVLDGEESARHVPDAVVTEVVPVTDFDQVATDRERLLDYIHMQPNTFNVLGNMIGE